MPKPRANDRDLKALSRAYLANFGESVRTLRERQGITLKQLAQMSGLSDRYIIQVEQGAANPSLESVLRLALALQTSMTGLLPEDTKNDTAEANGSARPNISSAFTYQLFSAFCKRSLLSSPLAISSAALLPP